MQESNVSTPRPFLLPSWPRIGFACFMLVVAVLAMCTEFFRFNWVGFLCFGLFELVYVPMQKGEAPKAYFSKPRTIVSEGLMAAVMASALHTLHYYLFTK